MAVLLMAASTSLGKSGEFKLDANGARHRKVFPFPDFARTEDGTDHLGREKRWKKEMKEERGRGRGRGRVVGMEVKEERVEGKGNACEKKAKWNG